MRAFYFVLIASPVGWLMWQTVQPPLNDPREVSRPVEVEVPLEAMN